MMRAPDLRLGQVQSTILRDLPPFEHRIGDPSRGIFVYARRGAFVLDIDEPGGGVFQVPQGTAVGFESGRPHRWRATSAKAAGVGPSEAVELFVSSIPRRMGVLQKLENGLIMVQPDEEPYASMIRHAVDLHVCEIESASRDDESIVRRCAEIVLIQFVRYARAKIAKQPDAPAGLVHDENLLRAWLAYFAEPRRRWTVQALADAAGLGRTSFAERFHRVFGAPPLQTLTSLRLEQAETMLRQTRTPLIEIAFTVGYNSEAAFVRAFHRAYGIPPGKFRSENGDK